MKEKNQDIVKSNALIEAVYNPGSIYQMRLLMAALMQIKAKEKIDYQKRYYVSANALADMTGNAAKNNYRELKKAAKDLMGTIVHVDADSSGIPLKRTMDINLVSSCEYIDNEGTVGLRFTEEIAPYVSDLKTRFTQYQAKYVMPMRSSYGIRLYELCLQWLGDEREFEVEEFKRLLGIENKYKLLEVLKRKVIKPALKDINTHSDIRVTFGQRKAGRKVTHLQFLITKPEPKAPKSKPLDHDTWITRFNMTKPYSPQGSGETYEQARQRTYGEYMLYRKNPEKWISARAPIEHDSIT